MITKPYKQKTGHRHVRLRAGDKAERQMAHYLNRRFRDDPEIHVLHDLRLVDPAQPEQDGSPGVCQIDHLIVHRWGLFIVESKSVTGEVCVRPDGSGGDEWSRVYGNRETGMPSPIRQVQRQSAFLRPFLQQNRKELLGRMDFGYRTVAKLHIGTDQRGFRSMPIQPVIAVSDEGMIRRLDGWEEPREPFRALVTKADLVVDKIDGELERHRKGPSMLSISVAGGYGVWSMETEETAGVAEFLAASRVVGTSPGDGNMIDTFKLVALDEGGVMRSRQKANGLRLVCRIEGGGKLAIWGKEGARKNIDAVWSAGLPCTVECEYQQPSRVHAEKYGHTQWVGDDCWLRVVS